LDNVVEGTHVNVRLQPDLDAPVIAQLNSGDRVEGAIIPSSNKWLEIALPASTRFYVSKEYIEKIGNAGYLARLEKRHDEVYRLLNTTNSVAESEIQKPFNQINLDGVIANYRKIISEYTDFPDAMAKAKGQLSRLQDIHNSKK